MDAKHTPTPWSHRAAKTVMYQELSHPYRIVVDANGKSIAKAFDEEGAETIVRACNSYDAMLKVLIAIDTNDLLNDGTILGEEVKRQVKAAIIKAEAA